MTTKVTTPSDPRPPEINEFPYGWRYVKRIAPDGSEVLDQVPLTLEHNLHPQEDDVIPETPIQEQERGDLARIFRSRLPRVERGLVLSDCLVDWGVPGIRNSSPDISVFAGVIQPHDPQKGTFRLIASGGRCLLAMEIVSLDTRVNDVERKFEEFYEVNVPLYILVDQKRQGGPRTLLGYRHTPNGYQAVEKDEHGCIRLDFLGLKLGMRDNGVICFDAESGEEIGDLAKELERRHEAEQQAHAEAQARQAAEQRIRELEDALRRQQGG